MTHHGDTEARSERPARFRVKPWWLIATAACLLGGLILSLAAVDPVAYHWWQFERLKMRGRVMTHPTVLDEVEEWLLGNVADRLYSHVEALEDLREVNSHHFRATYMDLANGIWSDHRKHTEWHHAVEKGRRSGELLASRGVVEPMGSGTQITVTVWCRPESSEKWATLAAEFDAGRDNSDIFVEETE